MLKSDVSKPVHFRPLLVGLFFFPIVTKWHEFIFYRATLYPQAVSGVESKVAAHRHRRRAGAAF